MSLTTLQRIVVDSLEDIKALDIQVFDTRELSDLFDRVILASATSNRQTRALASHLRERVKAHGFPVIATEGEDTGEWVLVDLGDIIVHIMQPAIRTYYNLEELWGRKPVRVRIGAGATAASRVGGLRPASKEKTPTKKAAATKPLVKAPVVKTPAAKAPVARKPAVKSPPEQTPGARKPVTKKATAVPAAKKPAAKKPAAKRKPAAKQARSHGSGAND